MKVGSLFAGIGGFDLGFERAGWETSWFCEMDPYCQAVLNKHWPGVPCYPDVTKLDKKVGDVDVLCGGFPCQDLSVAGKQAGIEGARSGLWSEYARLIGELRPRYIVVENVAALKRKGLGRVLGDLATLGYDAEWECLPASAFGAPHQRDRIWIVAYPNSRILRDEPRRGSGQGRCQASVVADDGTEGPLADSKREGLQGHISEAGKAQESEPRSGRPHVADADSKGRDGRPRQSEDRTGWSQPEDSGSTVPNTKRTRSQGSARWRDEGKRRQREFAASVNEEARRQWESEPAVGRVAHGVPNRVDRIKSLGNALVPQIAQYIAEQINEREAS